MKIKRSKRREKKDLEEEGEGGRDRTRRRRKMWATHPKLSINVNALLVIQQNLERKSQFEKKLLLISIISHLPLRCIAR